MRRRRREDRGKHLCLKIAQEYDHLDASDRTRYISRGQYGSRKADRFTGWQASKGSASGMAAGACNVPGQQNSNGFFERTLYHAPLDSRQLEMHERGYGAFPREHSILEVLGWTQVGG